MIIQKILPSFAFALLFVPLASSLSASEDVKKSFDDFGNHIASSEYVSRSSSITCTFKDHVLNNPTFFIMDDSADGFDVLTFGYQSGDQFLTWSIRKYRLHNEAISDAAVAFALPSGHDDYITKYYNQNLPYDIEGLSRNDLAIEGKAGTIGFLDVAYENAQQTHGYWLSTAGDRWLAVVQFMPALASKKSAVLSKADAKAYLFEILNQCTFD